MKRCRTCGRLYTDDTLNFCLDDGALLSTAQESQETLILDTPYRDQAKTEVLPSDSKANQPKSKISADITKPQSKRMWLVGVIGIIVIAFISSFLTFNIMRNQKSDEIVNTQANASPSSTPSNIKESPTPNVAPTSGSQPTPSSPSINTAGTDADSYYFKALNIINGRDLKTIPRADLIKAYEYFQYAQKGSYSTQASQYLRELDNELFVRRKR